MTSLVKTNNSSGIIYCAIGNKYIEQAVESYQSLLEYSPDIKATLFTNGNLNDSNWDVIIHPGIEYSINFRNQMVYKLDAILSTPYEKSLFLDTDTLVLDDLTELFLLLDKFDLVLCHGHNRARRFKLIQNAKSNSGETLFSNKIPYCFAPLQSGLILYNKSSTHDFFQNVRELYLSKNYFDDQAAIRELLWESDLRFYILPPEYNFNSHSYLKTLRKSGFEIAIPKIFHYTLNKEDDIRLLKRKLLKLNKPKRLSLKSFIKKIIRKNNPFRKAL